MTRSTVFNFILGSIFGFAIAAMLVAMHGHQIMAAPPEPPPACGRL